MSQSVRVSSAEYQRRWRQAHGAVAGRVGRPVERLCGTVAAYRRHLRRGETPCQECKDANSAEQRERRDR